MPDMRYAGALQSVGCRSTGRRGLEGQLGPDGRSWEAPTHEGWGPLKSFSIKADEETIRKVGWCEVSTSRTEQVGVRRKDISDGHALWALASLCGPWGVASGQLSARSRCRPGRRGSLSAEVTAKCCSVGRAHWTARGGQMPHKAFQRHLVPDELHLSALGLRQWVSTPCTKA